MKVEQFTVVTVKASQASLLETEYTVTDAESRRPKRSYYDGFINMFRGSVGNRSLPLLRITSKYTTEIIFTRRNFYYYYGMVLCLIWNMHLQPFNQL